MDTVWTIQLFGGLRATTPQRGEALTRFRTRKTAALLAALAFRIGENPSTRDELIEILWPESDPERSLARLAVEKSALLRQLEPPGIERGAIVRGDRFCISLDPAHVTTDVRIFEGLLRRAPNAESETDRIAFLSDALDHYSGPLLPDFDEEWIEPERERLRTSYVAAARDCALALMKRGDAARAAEVARVAVHRERLREEPYALLMRAEIALGHPDRALKHFDELTLMLEESAGARPAAEAEWLAAEARRLLESPAAASAPATAPLAAPPAVAAPVAPGPQAAPADAAGQPTAPLPTGVTAILTTDIEGSTALGRTLGDDRFAEILAQHHAVMRAEFRRAGGVEFQEAGDGFWAAFPFARDALLCAQACQRAITSAFPLAADKPRVRVRMAIHVADLRFTDEGRAHGAPGSYRGLALHDLSRLLSSAHGGQVYVSEAAEAVLRRSLPEGIAIVDRGRYRLRDAPGPENIYQALWDGALWDGDAAPTEGPPPNAPRVRKPIGLPPTLTRTFGRQPEIESICGALAPGHLRLLTLTGLGGSGKTRLGIEAAHALADRPFAGALWYVPLVGLHDSSRLADTLRTAFTVDCEAASGASDVFEAATAALAGEPGLLVLDNLEHLLEADDNARAAADFAGADGLEPPSANAAPRGVAELLQELLERVPGLSCLSTSRRRIGIEAEQEYPVRPLALPAAGKPTPVAALECPSVALFDDRARRARFDFQVTDRNVAAVVALCTRLEGIPLGLELAAAWARLLTPAEMLNQFEEVRRSRDKALPERHRSLDAAIEGSYRLLDDAQRALFRAFSVFRGGWSLEAAKVVCEEPDCLSLLSDLRDRSLIHVEDAEDSTRYGFLETVRTYAFSCLEDVPDQLGCTLRNHERYFAALAAEANDALQGPDQAAWLTRISAEHGNLSAALERLDRPARLKMASELHRYWIVRGFLAEGRKWLADVLAADMGDVPPEVLGKAINVAGVLAQQAGDSLAARSLFEVYAQQCRNAGNELGEAIATVNLGILAMERNEYSSAIALYNSTLDLWRKRNRPKTLASVLSNLGAATKALGDLTLAKVYLEEALRLQNDDQDAVIRCNTLQNLAAVSSTGKDFPAATYYASEVLKLLLRQANNAALPSFLTVIADIKAGEGHFELSARILGAAEAAAAITGIAFAPVVRNGIKKDLDMLCANIGVMGCTSAYRAGHEMTWEEILQCAAEAVDIRH